MFTEGVPRTGLHDGIHLHGVLYFSEELLNFIRNKGHGMKVNVRFDPDDIRRIAFWYDDPDDWMIVHAKDTACPAISVEELRAVRKRLPPIEREKLTASVIWREVVGVFEDQRKSGKTPFQRTKASARVDHRQQEISQKTATSPIADQSTSVSQPATRPQRPQNLPSTRRGRTS